MITRTMMISCEESPLPFSLVEKSRLLPAIPCRARNCEAVSSESGMEPPLWNLRRNSLADRSSDISLPAVSAYENGRVVRATSTAQGGLTSPIRSHRDPDTPTQKRCSYECADRNGIWYIRKYCMYNLRSEGNKATMSCWKAPAKRR